MGHSRLGCFCWCESMEMASALTRKMDTYKKKRMSLAAQANKGSYLWFFFLFQIARLFFLRIWGWGMLFLFRPNNYFFFGLMLNFTQLPWKRKWIAEDSRKHLYSSRKLENFLTFLSTSYWWLARLPLRQKDHQCCLVEGSFAHIATVYVSEGSSCNKLTTA